HCKAKVSDIIKEGRWEIPNSFLELLNTSRIDTSCFNRRLIFSEDRRIWTPDIKGVFSVHSAYDEIRNSYDKPGWCKLIWRPFVHPSTAGIAWKLMDNCAAIEEKIQRRGVHLVSMCGVCKQQAENIHHLLGECPFAKGIWEWIASKFRFRGDMEDM
ncbi:Ribonuclease h domain, partial [Thalictrum thalictroides]